MLAVAALALTLAIRSRARVMGGRNRRACPIGRP